MSCEAFGYSAHSQQLGSRNVDDERWARCTCECLQAHRRSICLPNRIQVPHRKRNGPTCMDTLRDIQENAIAEFARVIQSNDRHLRLILPAEVFTDTFPPDTTHRVFA